MMTLAGIGILIAGLMALFGRYRIAIIAGCLSVVGPLSYRHFALRDAATPFDALFVAGVLIIGIVVAYRILSRSRNAQA